MVGRGDEWSTITAVADRAVRLRTSHLVLVSGPAGIGKSLLLESFLSSRVSAVLIARTDPVDQSVPFGLFRDGLHRLQQAPDVDDATAAGVRQCLADLDAASWATTSPSAPSRINTIFASLRRVLAGLAANSADSAVVVALEDLHDADAESVALLYRLARHAVGVPVLTVATTRPASYDSQLRPFADRLEGDGRATVIDLPPLGRDEIGTLVAAQLGSAAPPDLVGSLFEESRGNPFFAKAAMAAMTRDGSSIPVGDSETANPIQGVTGDRSGLLLDRFFIEGDAEWRAASALAVLGRIALHDLHLLQQVAGLDAEQASRSFDRLVHSGLLVSSTPGEYSFAHDLLRSALYARIGAARAAHLHAVAAATMAEQRDRGTFDVFAYASHVCQSMSPDDPRLVESALEAAQLAITTAPLVAAEWFGRAAAALGHDPGRLATVRAQQTMALFAGNDSVRALDVGVVALAEAPEGFPRTALALTTATAASSSDRAVEAPELLDHELSINPDDLDVAVGRVIILSQTGRFREAAEAYAATAERARAVGPGADPFSGARTFSTLWAYAEQMGLREDRVVFGDMARACAERLPAPMHGGMLLFLNTQIGAARGSFDVAEAELTRAAELLGRSANPFSGDDIRVDVPTFGWFRGYWDQTIESVRTNVAFSVGGSNRTAAEVARSVGVLILTDRGDYSAAGRLAAGMEMGAELGRSLAAVAIARMSRTRGSVASAKDCLERRRVEMLTRGVTRMFTLVTEELVGYMLSSGDTHAARQTADQAWDVITGADSQILRLWGLRSIASAYGDEEAALRAEAIAADESLPFELAKCRLVLGEIGVKPEENLPAAIAAFDALRARPWRRRTGSVLKARGLPIPRASRRTDELTNTEREILGLLEQRLTNRQIADAMTYSEKTIEAYLSRVYAKTDVSSRLEMVQAIHAGRVKV